MENEKKMFGIRFGRWKKRPSKPPDGWITDIGLSRRRLPAATLHLRLYFARVLFVFCNNKKKHFTTLCSRQLVLYKYWKTRRGVPVVHYQTKGCVFSFNYTGCRCGRIFKRKWNKIDNEWCKKWGESRIFCCCCVLRPQDSAELRVEWIGNCMFFCALLLMSVHLISDESFQCIK